MADKKNPTEASNIFHSIIKASVKPPEGVTVKEYEHEGHKYWVTVVPAMNTQTNVIDCYFAYVKDTKPNDIVYGDIVKDDKGKPIRSQDVTSALFQANAVKKSIIDSKRK